MKENTKCLFWSKVNKTDSCWLWTAGCFPNGYGAFNVNRNKKGAHRVAYELTYGPITKKHLVVRHTCDVKHCVRPSHLLLGTQRENNDDAIDRNLWRHGETHGMAKLTNKEVRQIRQALKTPYYGLQADLARQYNVRPCTINHIKFNRNHKHTN